MSKEERARIDQLFKEKLPANIAQYKESGEKPGGTNTGFRGSRDHQEYMIKSAKMHPSNKKEMIMKNDLLHEYMAYFERFMYDRTAVLGMIFEDKKEETKYNFRIVQDLKKESPQTDEILIGIVDLELCWKKTPNGVIEEVNAGNGGIPENLHTNLINNCYKQTQLTEEQAENLNKALNNAFDMHVYLRSKMIQDFIPLDKYTKYQISITEDIDSANPKPNEIILGVKNAELYLKNGTTNNLEKIVINNDLKKGVPSAVYTGLKEWVEFGEKPAFQITNYFDQHLILKHGYTHQEKLMNAEGFEKAIAACAYFGDMDFNGGNLGLINQDGKNYIAKIDHGRACSFFTSEPRLRQSICEHLKIFCYHNLNIDANKLKESVDEIITISDEEIEALVKQRAFNLRKTGFVLDDNIIYYLDGKPAKLAPADNTAKTSTQIEESRWKNLEANYVRLYKQQKTTLKALSETLGKIIDSDIPEKLKEKSWIYLLKGENFEKWKKERDKKIQDKENQPLIIDNVNAGSILTPNTKNVKTKEILSR